MTILQCDTTGMAGDQYPELVLTLLTEHAPFFTTLFQYGVESTTAAQTQLGEFLANCPGFTPQYLADNVQTIFLNGAAVDNLQIPLAGKHPVVALSAAMPGLAGAIFRKSGAHASLRTQHKSNAGNTTASGPLPVTLKLFNQIAREKGLLLLSLGVVINVGALTRFLEKRPEIIDMLKGATFASSPIDKKEVIEKIHSHTFIKLRINSTNTP